jgi:hypothetical protein
MCDRLDDGKKDPRKKYSLGGQAKQGGKITHMGITSNAVGFMDFKITRSIDKNMVITDELVDITAKKAVVKETLSATGTKQYKINQDKY